MKKNLLKIFVLVLILALSITLFVACIKTDDGKTTSVDETVIDLLDFSIEINYGESSSTTFTQADLATLTLADFEVTVIDDNETEVREYKGYSFADVFTLKGIETYNPCFTFTSIPNTPTGSGFVQNDNSCDALSTYYFAFFEDKGEGYKAITLTVEDAAGADLVVNGVRNVCTSQQFKTYWVKGLREIDILAPALNVDSLAEFDIDVNGTNFSEEDLVGMDLYEVATTTIKDDIETTTHWVGVKVEDMLGTPSAYNTITYADGDYIKIYSDTTSAVGHYLVLFEYDTDENVYVEIVSEGDYRNICTADNSKGKWVKGLATITTS